MQRVVVLGGAGNFGARIVRALLDEPGVEVLVAARRIAGVPGGARAVAMDMAQAGFDAALRALSPRLVIHCAGPFQSQDYRVVRAAMSAGAHYIDLADGRQFVAGFGAANDAIARAAGRTAICGASTLPALSSAVVDHLAVGLGTLESIETVVAPGHVASRGVATLQAVFSYLGRPVRVFEQGQWRERTGWMDLRHVPLAFGARWGAVCDVPDMELFPLRYPSLRTARFHAALEFKVQHALLWALAASRRAGLPVRVDRWARLLDRAAGWFDAIAGEWGGMWVRVEGTDATARRVSRTWQLRAPARDGPEVPCMAAILLARSLLAGDAIGPGASACVSRLPLAAFNAGFARWGMVTSIEEAPAA